jgi:hypothetical protein
MRRHWPILIVSGLLSLSVAANVWLARGFNQRKGQPAQSLAEGTRLPGLEATELASGRPATVAFAGDHPTVLYVFSPQCSWCTKNLEGVKTLARERRSDYRFLGLSLSEAQLAPYVAQSDFGFPVYSQVSKKTREAYRLGPTPELIVVSPEGRVLKAWRGAFLGPLATQIESYFKVKLPAIPANAEGGSSEKHPVG